MRACRAVARCRLRRWHSCLAKASSSACTCAAWWAAWTVSRFCAAKSAARRICARNWGRFLRTTCCGRVLPPYSKPCRRTAMTELPLAGQCIWLTRPEQQSEDLQRALGELGAATFCLPLLDIRFAPLEGASLDCIKQLDRYDLVFFVSSNAVRAGLEAIGNWWPQYPAGIL